MTIQAVFFDMGGTIETFWYDQALRLNATSAFQEKLSEAGINFPLGREALYQAVSDGLARYHNWSLETMDELTPGRVWCEYIFPEYPEMHTSLREAGEALMHWVEAHYYQRQMRPEIPGVVKTIRRMGLKMGIISNVCSLGLVPANLEAYGIRGYFCPVVLSSEYGRRKPDPAIFHYAARLANVPASDCIYVGDRIARDVLGAHKAGFRLAIQIRHDFRHGEADAGATPDVQINHMTELLDILRSEMQSFTQSGSSSIGYVPYPIRALLFDAGDILYYRPHHNRKFPAFLKELGIAPDQVDSIEKQALINHAYQGEINQDQYWDGLLRLYGVTQPDLLERGKAVLEEDENAVHFFDGVPETLTTLKGKGYLLGIITDTSNPVSIKLRWFERGGFGNVWDSIISSKEMGIRKPHPQIYRAALEQLGVRADQAVFVGHKNSELEGARRVGIKTIAFNYEDKASADYFIEKFSDLINVPLLNHQDDNQ